MSDLLANQISKYIREVYNLKDAVVGFNDERGYIYIRTEDANKPHPECFNLYRFPITLNV